MAPSKTSVPITEPTTTAVLLRGFFLLPVEACEGVVEELAAGVVRELNSSSVITACFVEWTVVSLSRQAMTELETR